MPRLILFKRVVKCKSFGKDQEMSLITIFLKNNYERSNGVQANSEKEFYRQNE